MAGRGTVAVGDGSVLPRGTVAVAPCGPVAVGDGGVLPRGTVARGGGEARGGTMTAARDFTSDPGEMKRAFAEFPSGVAALAALVDGDPALMIVSSFAVGVSYDPPMVSFAVRHGSTTWPRLSRTRAIGVSVLGAEHTGKARQMASRSKENRFAGLGTREAASGAVFLDGAPVWLECAVEHSYPAGDHDIILLRVLAMLTDDERDPVVWHRRTFKVLASVPWGSASAP